MFVIALVGRKAIQRFGFLSHHAEAVRKVFGVLILLSVGFLAFGSAVPGGDDKPVPVHDAGRLEEPLEHPYPAPELTGIQEWLNSKPLSIAQLRGKVVLIDFWTYSCINCVRTLPSITAWDRQYRDKGLVIIGVHAPEFEFEKNIANIRAALIRHGIAYPVAVDNRLESWGAFHNQYWPAHYLIDQEGRVVYTHFGEGDYAVTENNIRYLLGLKDKVAAEDEAPASVNQTPETYLGYGRAENFLSLSGRQEDMPALYQPAAALPEHHWTLSGKWKIEEQKIVAQEDGAVLRLNFTARKLFLVMGNAEGKAQKAVLRLNGKALGESSGKDVQDSAVTIARPTLYELVSQPHRQNALLEIQLPAGVEAYAFTFGE